MGADVIPVVAVCCVHMLRSLCYAMSLLFIYEYSRDPRAICNRPLGHHCEVHLKVWETFHWSRSFPLGHNLFHKVSSPLLPLNNKTS